MAARVPLPDGLEVSDPDQALQQFGLDPTVVSPGAISNYPRL